MPGEIIAHRPFRERQSQVPSGKFQVTTAATFPTGQEFLGGCVGLVRRHSSL
jgi:hypothetical protein